MSDSDPGSAGRGAAPACGARMRRGGRCLRAALPGRSRCAWHGGHARSGAPRGNRNAVKHGFCTAAARAERRQVEAFMRECLRTMEEIEGK